MKKSLIRQLKSEDWVIVGAGAAILLLALLFPRWMPAMPKDLSSAGNWMSAGAMFLFLLVLTGVCQRILGRPLRRFAVSLLAFSAWLCCRKPWLRSPQLNDWASRRFSFR